MNHLYRSILICLLGCNISFAQQIKKEIEPALLECKYNYMVLRDTLSNSIFKNDVMILRIGAQSNSFFSEHTFKLDSLICYAGPDYPLHSFIEAFLYLEDFRYYDKNSMLDYTYQNYPEGKITVQARHEKIVFQYEEPLLPQQWTIVPDSTRQIINHSCQLATCEYRGRKYLAWFTEDLPVQTGPWKFYGLPGLIMEVYDTDKHHHYQITEIKENVSQPVSIYFFPEQKVSTRKEVAKILREGMAKSAEKNKEKGEEPPIYDFMEKDY
ncbi:MAG: GLPGLI family protein [Bacteroides sp.]|nr:GLPGLI family protein [Bacteroides sp.]